MQALIIITFILSIIMLQASFILMIILRKPNISITDIFWQGSFIFRNLGKYIEPSKLRLVRYIGFIGAILFLLWIALLLINKD